MTDDNREPGLDLLQKDVGEWSADISVFPGPGAAPQLSKGTLVARLISGGRWLVTDFVNHTTGFEGHGIYGYNAPSKRFIGTWVDDMRTNLHLGEGTWDEASLTMTYVWRATMPDGQTRTWRETTKTVSPTEQLFRVLSPLPDGAEFEVMRAVYRRV